MKKPHFIFSICFLLVTFFSCHANDFLEYDNFLQLYETKDPSIISKEDNKFYLEPNRISVSEDGVIYLHSDLWGALPIQHISQDEEGLHTLMFCTYMCNKCGAQYRKQPARCQKIINPKTKERCGSRSFRVIGLLPD